MRLRTRETETKSPSETPTWLLSLCLSYSNLSTKFVVSTIIKKKKKYIENVLKHPKAYSENPKAKLRSLLIKKEKKKEENGKTSSIRLTTNSKWSSQMK